ncbi:hypothetical protein GGS20DRAFT_587022 [Poronia punctata]|nr:hypothetical protein GGS20DRAFT_587022 [Poronia punctata]
MAHIAACMIDSDGETHSLKSYIANPFSAKASSESLISVHSVQSAPSIDEKRPFGRRMHNQEPRKYALFPKEQQLPPLAVGKPLDPEQAFAAAMALSPDRSDKSGPSNGLLLRIKEHNLNRRRKVSVPELGPMTTVQEVSMDSPTIPGRPDLHERSISTPVNTLRLNLRPGPAAARTTCSRETGAHVQHCMPTLPPRQPLSPRDLAPLTIPTQDGASASIASKPPLGQLRIGTNQHAPPVRPPRPDESPRTRLPFTPFTPLSSTSSGFTPRSATTYMTASTIPTPVSAPVETRHSPTPWGKAHLGGASITPQIQDTNGSAPTHKRGNSEPGSIMERGRPRKRTDGTLIGVSHRRAESKYSFSAERRAFETLPQGFKPNEAAEKMDQTDIAHLQQQALGQAMRFEVLKKEDVDSLSKELRQLDERTEYLRHTYTSLRAGRRNLQSRICQYLRSPRVAKFSYEAMLRQEETLGELDASIDDWVTKLEHAENRRTRVRQKLLEHVAAAAIMSTTTDLAKAGEGLQQTTGTGPRVQPSAGDVATPPRSPIQWGTFLDCSPSPDSSPQRVVARVPSAIIEEDEDSKSRRSRFSSRSHLSSRTQSALQRMESIRIYADSDVYALLEDVENEFTKLDENSGTASPERLSVRPPHGDSGKPLQQAYSRDVLSRGSPSAPSAPTKTFTRMPPLSPPAPSPPMKNSPTKDGDVFLTSAVFQPHQASITA